MMWRPFLDWLGNSHDLPPFLAHVQTMVPMMQSLPGRPFMYALAIFAAVFITCRHRTILSLTDLVVLCTFVPAAAYGISMLGGTFNNVLGSVEAPPFVLPLLISSVTAFTLALIIRAGLHLEDDFGVGYSLIVGLIVGAYVVAPILLPAVAYDASMYWYPVFGFLVAVPIAKANKRGSEA